MALKDVTETVAKAEGMVKEASALLTEPAGKSANQVRSGRRRSSCQETSRPKYSCAVPKHLKHN